MLRLYNGGERPNRCIPPDMIVNLVDKVVAAYL